MPMPAGHHGIVRNDPAQGLLVGLPFPNPFVGVLAMRLRSVSRQIVGQTAGAGRWRWPRAPASPARRAATRRSPRRVQCATRFLRTTGRPAARWHSTAPARRAPPPTHAAPTARAARDPPEAGRSLGPQVRDPLGGGQRQQRPVEVQRPILEMVATNPQQVVQVGGDTEQHQRISPIAVPAPALLQRHPRQRQQQVQPGLQRRGPQIAKAGLVPRPHVLGVVGIGQPVAVVAVAKQEVRSDEDGEGRHEP